MQFNKLIWIPRVLAIVFIAFLLLFGLDVFSGEGPFLNKLGGFFVHSIPALILILTLIIAWSRPLIGGCIFILGGIAFTIFFRTYRSFPTFLLLTVSLVLIGILFIALGRKAKTSAGPA
jgi:hypothetical protein